MDRGPILSFGFLRSHGRLIAFGFMMFFCSNVGQTFFISLFGGEIRAQFALSHGQFGLVYTTATLASAMTLVWAGRFVDRLPLAVFAAAVLVALAGASLFMGVAWSVPTLILALFGLRFFGQGLATHTALVAMARYFTAERGRTVSIASLGQTAGEAFLPALVVASITVTAWRNIWTIAAGVLLVLLPLLLILLKGHKARDQALIARQVADRSSDSGSTLCEALRGAGLWLVLPADLAPSLIFSGLIIHQAHLAASKQWPPSLIGGSFTAFAVASLATLIVAGPLVDRITAQRLLPLSLVPLMLACLILLVADAPLAAPVFLALLGISMGITAILKGTLWPELYGISNLGSIRAFGQSAMVLSSGVGPALLGFLFDAGYSVEVVVSALIFLCLLASALAVLGVRQCRRERLARRLPPQSGAQK